MSAKLLAIVFITSIVFGPLVGLGLGFVGLWLTA